MSPSVWVAHLVEGGPVLALFAVFLAHTLPKEHVRGVQREEGHGEGAKAEQPQDDIHAGADHLLGARRDQQRRQQLQQLQ